MTYDLNKAKMAVSLIIGAIIVLIVSYIIQSLVLTNLNKKIYGKKTVLAWIPICNIYLLGKLTLGGSYAGWGLLIASFVCTASTSKTGTNGEVVTTTLVPQIVTNIYYVCYFILFIYAIIKLASKKTVGVNNNIVAKPVAAPLPVVRNEVPSATLVENTVAPLNGTDLTKKAPDVKVADSVPVNNVPVAPIQSINTVAPVASTPVQNIAPEHSEPSSLFDAPPTDNQNK